MQIIFGPPEVTDPDIAETLHSILPKFSCEVVRSFINSCDEEAKEKLRVIVDRIEFVQKLRYFKQFLEKRKSIPKKHDLGPITERKELHRVQCFEEILFDGEDFSGIDYDIEALCIYLLLTCVDTIVGKAKHKEQGDWLVETWSADNPKTDCIPIKFIKKSKENYFESWGTGRAFKRAFKQEISEELRQRLVSEFALLRLEDGKLDEDSKKEWDELGKDQRVKKLSDFLFNVRNIYTHTSRRTFLPKVPIERLLATKDCVLVAFAFSDDPAKGDLVSLLLDVIEDLIKSKIFVDAKHG
jgi:hypothetical protein